MGPRITSAVPGSARAGARTTEVARMQQALALCATLLVAYAAVGQHLSRPANAPLVGSALNGCHDVILLEVRIDKHSDEIQWWFDDEPKTKYTTGDDGQTFNYEAPLSSRHVHTFHYADKFGDGWRGGHWKLSDVCGNAILDSDEVQGVGGSVDVHGSSLCCGSSAPTTFVWHDKSGESWQDASPEAFDDLNGVETQCGRE